jgi:hypothetical protein
MAWIHTRFCKLPKGCTRLAAANDKVYQLLAHGWWFSPGTPASSTAKTGRHDIAEILLKVALSTINESIILDFAWRTDLIISDSKKDIDVNEHEKPTQHYT